MSIFFIFLVSLYLIPTGKVALQISPSYTEGEQLSGNLKLILKQGEFIPADTQFIARLEEQEKTFSLSQLLTEDTITGNFYVENKEISGVRLGNGLEVGKIRHQEI